MASQKIWVRLRQCVRIQSHRLRFREFSSSTTNTSHTAERDKDRATISNVLGLKSNLVDPYTGTIEQLPEVASVLTAKGSDKGSVELLRRAGDIFKAFQAGGREHVAVVSLLAEIQHGLGHYESACQTLKELQKIVTEREAEVSVRLALSKTLWDLGRFSDSLRIASELTDEPDLQLELPLYVLAATNAKAVSLLFLEGPTPARDIMQDAASSGEALSSLIRSGIQLNLGVLQALHDEAINCEGDKTCATRYETANTVWDEGIALLESDSVSSAVKHSLEGKLHCNLSWSGLQIAGNDEKQLSKASEHARKALQSLENNNSLGGRERLTRPLTLVGRCCHRAQQAITAEGLFQSALDYPAVTPQQNLEQAAAYQAYGDLCKDWEKRHGDSDKLEAKAKAILDALPEGWKGKSELHSSLWFWTPGVFSMEK